MTGFSDSITYASDSPIKNYDELMQAVNSGKAIYLIHGNNIYSTIRRFGNQGEYISFERFYNTSSTYGNLNNVFVCDAFYFNSIKIIKSYKQYTLTPTT